MTEKSEISLKQWRSAPGMAWVRILEAEEEKSPGGIVLPPKTPEQGEGEKLKIGEIINCGEYWTKFGLPGQGLGEGWLAEGTIVQFKPTVWESKHIGGEITYLVYCEDIVAIKGDAEWLAAPGYALYEPDEQGARKHGSIFLPDSEKHTSHQLLQGTCLDSGRRIHPQSGLDMGPGPGKGDQIAIMGGNWVGLTDTEGKDVRGIQTRHVPLSKPQKGSA